MANIKILTLALCVSLSIPSYATDLDQIYNIIKHVESNNKESAIGDNGKAYGVVQIHKICVADINRIYKTEYTHRQAFDETCSREMFMLYISYGIKVFNLIRCRSPTEEEIVKMWNGGIYRGYLKKSTRAYYERYKKFKRLYNKGKL
jgi:hypothetical protein